MPKAFVTGAAGFIGRSLVRALLDRGWDVRVLLHDSRFPEADECEVLSGDITDPDVLRRGAQGSDVLFHLAASLGGSLLPQDEFFRINAAGTENVFRAAKETGVGRVLHFSSAGVIGAVNPGDVAREDYPLSPKDIYDRSKLEGEQTALRFAREGLESLIIRPGWVYGPGDRRTFKLIKVISNKKFVLLTGHRTRQTPIYIDDLIAGTLLVLERGKSGEIYHLAGKEVMTVKDLVEAIGQACGTSVPRLLLPLTLLKTSAWVLGRFFALFKKEASLTPGKLAFFIHPKPLDISKAREELGFEPVVPFKDGIRSALAWYRDQGWL